MEGKTNQPYGYAYGNPVNYVDPSGLEGIGVGGEEELPLGPRPAGPGVGAGANSGEPLGVEGAGGATTGMGQLRAAIANRQIRPINYKYRGKVYNFEPGSKLTGKYPEGVRFTEDGFPDFSPYARATVKVRMRGTSTDISEANRVAGPKVTESMGVETWHHVEDRITMQLVPYDLHKAVAHTGGEGIIRVLGELPWEP